MRFKSLLFALVLLAAPAYAGSWGSGFVPANGSATFTWLAADSGDQTAIPASACPSIQVAVVSGGGSPIVALYATDSATQATTSGTLLISATGTQRVTVPQAFAGTFIRPTVVAGASGGTISVRCTVDSEPGLPDCFDIYSGSFTGTTNTNPFNPVYASGYLRVQVSALGVSQTVNPNLQIRYPDGTWRTVDLMSTPLSSNADFLFNVGMSGNGSTQFSDTYAPAAGPQVRIQWTVTNANNATVLATWCPVPPGQGS